MFSPIFAIITVDRDGSFCVPRQAYFPLRDLGSRPENTAFFMQNNFWVKLKKPIMAQAPMSGVTDEAFRLILLACGKPGIFWTEFISADALFCQKPKAIEYCLQVLKHSVKEKPIIAQIFGSNPLHIEKACQVIAGLGFDGVDINMGCPDHNVEKQGAGSALIKNPELAKEIIRAAKKSKLPVSVKTRIGYNKDEIEVWVPAILQESISALTVHFRTRKEGYMPPAHWEVAEKIIELRDKYAPQTLIIGNGDIQSLKQAKELCKKYKLDGVMVGRALMGNPWFFSGKTPTVKQKLQAIVEHAEILEGLGYIHFDSIKKHFHAYAKGFAGAKELHDQLMKVKSAKETKLIIKNFEDK